MGYELANELCSRRDFVKLPASAIAQLKAVVPQGLFTADHDDWFWGPAHRILVPALGPMAIKEMFPGQPFPHVSERFRVSCMSKV